VSLWKPHCALQSESATAASSGNQKHSYYIECLVRSTAPTSIVAQAVSAKSEAGVGLASPQAPDDPGFSQITLGPSDWDRTFNTPGGIPRPALICWFGVSRPHHLSPEWLL